MDPHFDPLTARFAIVIAVITTLLLVTMVVRADPTTSLERVEALNEPPDATEPDGSRYLEDGTLVGPDGFIRLGPRRTDADELADRVLAWVERRSDASFRFDSRAAQRRRWPDRQWVRTELVPAAIEAAQGAHYPDAWPDAELLLVKAYWEARWIPTRIGRLGEVGVLQVIGRHARRFLVAGERIEDLAETRLNMRVAARIMREKLEGCPGRPGYALHAYASGDRICRPPRFAERRVMTWAQQLRVQHAGADSGR